jgi:hypothetical protein
MSNSTDSYGYLLFWLVIIHFCFNDTAFDTKSVRVTETLCNGSWNDAGECSGKLTLASDLYFLLNPTGRAVQLIVKRNSESSPWFVRTLLLKGCEIVDDSNWECTLPSGADTRETIGLSDGAYFHQSSGGFGYEIRGVNGWGYWWLKIVEPKSR